MMGSVAIVEDDVLIAEQLLNIKVTHTERLIPSIEAVLQMAGCKLEDIDGFAVTIGPGSFTGLRIGLAAVKGMAFSLNKPVVGVSSLTSLAYNFFGSDKVIVSVLDARRGEYYVAVNKFDGGDLVNILEDTVMPPDELIEYVAALDAPHIVFVGDGVYGLREQIREKLSSRSFIPPPAMIHPRASNVAWLGLNRLANGDHDDLAGIKPNYVRKSDAELTKKDV
jgi:tRNA threonylcarbamoyladenosine biosynthesis protein TsaB